MMRAGRGRIVNIVTRLGFGNPYSSAYMASKNALWGFTQCLAIELASYGMTVNAVAPGHVGPGTGMEKQFREKADKLGLTWEAFEAQVLKTIPVGRWCRPGRCCGGSRVCGFAGSFIRDRRADQRHRRLHRLRHRSSEGGGLSKDLRAGGIDRLTVEDILKPGFSTPWDAPTIPPFPFTFRNAEMLTLVWRTTEAAVARLLAAAA